MRGTFDKHDEAEARRGIIPAYAESTAPTRALAAAMAEMHVTGTSPKKVEEVAAKFGVEPLAKDQVSRLCAVIDSEVDAFLAKDWLGTRFAYPFLDATYVRYRVDGRVRCVAFITAISVGDDGRRRFVGFTCANTESYAF